MNDLFDLPARARGSDPDTSHEAADSITEADVNALFGRILQVLRRCAAG